ncbi:Acetylxylan esterase 6 [Phlyctema vagabunda]|uniref:Acetylxylan esterase 6 n=1 Tax=Phlyctema vagabunda TaxID=108571 RepID=A0ABR4PEH3_9HELO
MLSLPATLVFFPFALVAAAGIGARDAITTPTTCSAVHIFVARGFDEEYPGRQSVLVDAVCDDLSSCDYEDIVWVTSMEYGFCDAVSVGTANGLSQITKYNEQCPDAALVLTGYSQGAHVVGDMLGGGNGTFFDGCVQKSNDGLDPSTAPGNKIVAALAFGDDRHTANQSYNVESGSALQGFFPRSAIELEPLEKYAGVLRSYCAAGDPICANGDVVAEHLNYFEKYTDDAAAWVKKMVSQNATALSTTPSSSSSASASSSSQTSTADSSAQETASSVSASSTSSSTATGTAASASSTSTNGASLAMYSMSAVGIAFVAVLGF